MSTIYLVGALVLVTVTCIGIAIRVTKKSGAHQAQSRHDRHALEARRRFDESMRQPLSRGTDLVDLMRARAELSEHDHGSPEVPDPKSSSDR